MGDDERYQAGWDAGWKDAAAKFRREPTADVAELVKAARETEEAIRAWTKSPREVELSALWAAHRAIQAALRPFTREA